MGNTKPLHPMCPAEDEHTVGPTQGWRSPSACQEQTYKHKLATINCPSASLIQAQLRALLGPTWNGLGCDGEPVAHRLAIHHRLVAVTALGERPVRPEGCRLRHVCLPYRLCNKGYTIQADTHVMTDEAPMAIPYLHDGRERCSEH